MFERAETVCFSGHRAGVDLRLPALQRRLDKEIEQLIVRGITRFLVGGALGFDTLAALAVINVNPPEYLQVYRLSVDCKSKKSHSFGF